MQKTFVLDTNVLLHNAECIESFADNRVVLPMAVIEELDRFKKNTDELGRNARQVIRRIDALRSQGNLHDGVPLANGGLLQIVTAHRAPDGSELTGNEPDNLIVRVAYALHKQGERVIFVSKDINARLKADALGLQAVDFEKEKVNFDELYAGYSEVVVASEVIDAFFKQPVLEQAGLGRYPNEFVILRDASDAKRSALGRVITPGRIKHLSSQYEKAWDLQSRNKE